MVAHGCLQLLCGFLESAKPASAELYSERVPQPEAYDVVRS
jgi:hypothetical protein